MLHFVEVGQPWQATRFDITAEAADAVVLEASLGRVDELIHIGRRMRAIALQCAIGGMGLSIIGMGFAAAAYLRPVAGAIAQEIIDVLAILNALRMVLPSEDLEDLKEVKRMTGYLLPVLEGAAWPASGRSVRQT
jgi:cation transport ATPase